MDQPPSSIIEHFKKIIDEAYRLYNENKHSNAVTRKNVGDLANASAEARKIIDDLVEILERKRPEMD